MKKLVKIFAVVLAVLMLGSVVVACDKGSTDEETVAETTASVKVSIIVKANGKTVYKETPITTTKTTLGEALELFCAYWGDDVTCNFDASTGLLTKLGTVVPGSGERFLAYDASKGQDEEFKSIKDHVLVDGQTIVIDTTK